MPIVIVEDFQMNADKPIDNRIVVGSQSFYKNKSSIIHKYNGLRIWDLNDNIPYYWNGATWSSENAIGVIVDNTPVDKPEVSYIPKFTTGPTIIGKSKIYDNVVNIGIGVTGSAIVTNTTPTITLGLALNQNANETGLHVAGNIRTNRHFIGNGEYIQNINASNINGGAGAGGRLGIQWIQSKVGSTLNTDYVLINKNNTNTWENFSDKVNNVISVNNINITDDTTSTTDKLLTFVSSTGNSPINVSSSKLKFRPSTGQLFLTDGSSTSPVYSFLNSLNTGMYYSPNTDSVKNLGFSVDGSEITRFNTNGVFITKGRLYIPLSVNDSNAGHGIIFNNDTIFNDGFTYEQRRLNNYGIGSHLPTSASQVNGRGIYISGFFGVDIFTGAKLKLKVHEVNDVTINSRLNISNTNDTLGGVIGNNVVLSTMTNMGGSGGNTVVIKDWSVRGTTGTDWLTWKHHNGITVDGVYNTPNGPNSGGVIASGTLTFWERHPYIHEQYFGSIDKKTLTINSGLTNQFVKVDGLLNVLGSINGNTTISGNWIATNTEAVNATIDNKVMTPMKTKTVITAIKSTSTVLSYNNSSTVTWSHGLSGIPDFVSVTFICKAIASGDGGSGGYAIGDRLQVSPTSEASGQNEGYSLQKNSTNIIIRIGNGAGKYMTTSYSGEIFLFGACWNLEITAYKF